jgi:hypothetical protein
MIQNSEAVDRRLSYDSASQYSLDSRAPTAIVQDETHHASPRIPDDEQQHHDHLTDGLPLPVLGLDFELPAEPTRAAAATLAAPRLSLPRFSFQASARADRSSFMAGLSSLIDSPFQYPSTDTAVAKVRTTFESPRHNYDSTTPRRSEGVFSFILREI